LVVGGVDPNDLPDPHAALAALDAAGFVVSLELRESEVTRRADVVFPVAAAVEKAGTFLDWEGRARPFEVAVPDTGGVTDARALHMLADELDVSLGTPDVATTRREIGRLGRWTGPRAEAPSGGSAAVPQPAAGQAVLATWHLLIDDGRMLDGEPYLAGTARAPVVRLSPATAAEIGAAQGELVRVATDRGAVELPLFVTAMADRVVWLPTNSPGCHVRRTLGADTGAVVTLGKAGSA
ncbi:MAG: molybdopterin-dependent oxidoreductase, partial [Actinomycetota bacterium]|nr:molybdopterin-dependent oxidoreductase [Actinomycetota bacterium]